MCRRAPSPRSGEGRTEKNMNEVEEKLRAMLIAAKEAARFLACRTPMEKNRALLSCADRLLADKDAIFAANEQDLSAARAAGMKPSTLDRLALDEKRLLGMAGGIRKVEALPDPTGLSEGWLHQNGMEIQKRRVPLGVVGIIYEARPNVTSDAAALCLKSGNAVVLRGGKEALNTNTALVNSLRAALCEIGFPAECVSLIESADRAYTTALLNAVGLVDLVIPRGGKGLISFVAENARVPVIETGAGNCHVYVHKDADLDMAVRILVNAKISRPSVCNAAEHLLVHSDAAEAFLPLAARALQKEGVALRGCARCVAVESAFSPVGDEDYATEYNDLILSAKVVDSLEEAAAHINRYGTHHSETIVTKDLAASERFCALVDSAAVYTNASTRFTDGEEFGFGAEIGISTQKLHVRGPMGLNDLTTVKYLVRGDGQIRA